jgi:hypothetical protein
MDVVGVKEVGEILGWDHRKVSVYLGRGKLPAPMARLASGPVWWRRDIETYARGEVVAGAQGIPLPEEHIRALLWAHFEAARVGLLRPPEYGDLLPWAVDGKPPGHARSLRGLAFPIAYRELWPKFLQTMMDRPDWAELLARSELLWDAALATFDELRDAWELRFQ